MTFINRRIPSVNYRDVLTASAPLSATVGASSGLIVPANTARVGLVLQNLATTGNVYLGINIAAVLQSGITLFPGFGWELDAFSFVVDDIFAIADTPGTVVSIQEFVL